MTKKRNWRIICAVNHQQLINKKTKNMKIDNLKVVSVKEWRMASQFKADNGQTYDIPANHKIVCLDEVGDIVNVSVITEKPLNLTVGSKIAVSVAGNVQHNSFGWTLKARLA